MWFRVNDHCLTVQAEKSSAYFSVECLLIEHILFKIMQIGSVSTVLPPIVLQWNPVQSFTDDVIHDTKANRKWSWDKWFLYIYSALH